MKKEVNVPATSHTVNICDFCGKCTTVKCYICGKDICWQCAQTDNEMMENYSDYPETFCQKCYDMGKDIDDGGSGFKLAIISARFECSKKIEDIFEQWTECAKKSQEKE